MALNGLMKQNIETMRKIKLYFLIAEEIVLLSIGIYNLINDNSIIIPSFVLFIIAYSISLLKSRIFKTDLQKETKTFKKKMIIGIITYLSCIVVSVLRKNILGKYFIGQQIIIVTIWFLIGVVTGNIIALILPLIRTKTKMTIKRRIFVSNIRIVMLSFAGFASVALVIRTIFSVLAGIQGNGSAIELMAVNKGIVAILIFAFFTIIINIINNIFTYRLTKTIVQPLEPLIEGARQVHDNNFAYRIDYQKDDEFRPVCEAFNEMAARLEASAAQKQKDEVSRRELIAGISHDLRTPLTLIKGYLEGIETGAASTPEIREKYFATIKKRAGDIEHISEQLFLLSKLDMNEFPLTMRHVDVFCAVSDMIEEVIEEYARRGLVIQLTKTHENLLVSADPLWLRNVVINILENSVNYKIKEKGEMKIDAFIVEKFVVLRFSDDGPGVSNEAIPKLFDAFYRTDPSRNKKGSGLGLAISAKIIEYMDGGIFAEPSSLGGLAIIIRLPLLQGDDLK